MNPDDGPLSWALMPDTPSHTPEAGPHALPEKAERGGGADKADEVCGATAPQALRAEAARYALLRRLSPALRHEAAAPLQPIAMAASVLERRLAEPTPELAPIRDSALRLVGYARTAAQCGLDLVGWLSPDRQARLPLADVVEHALSLLATPLGFEGFTLASRIEAGLSARPVPRAALQLMLPGCLLWLSDQAAAPGTLWLEAVTAPGTLAGARADISLRLSVEPTTDRSNEKAGSPCEPAYRRLGWTELLALAHSEGLDLRLEGQALVLALPPEP